MTTNKPEVKRYEPESGYNSVMRKVNWMQESESGGYVRFDDYEAMQAECEELRKENQRLKDGALEDLRLRTSALEMMNAANSEAEALRKDAERYRWLRDECPRNWDVMYRDVEILIEEPQADDCEDLDGIIDAAMQRTSGSE